MKCAKCDGTKHTVGEIRGCAGCQDGTAQQIPASIPDTAPIADAIAAREGIGNRFKPGGDPAPEPEAQPEEAAKPAKPKASRKRT